MGKGTREDRLLTGWKAIAAELQCSVRTAQRWRSLEGMPVEFHRHLERSTPIASAKALREWRDKRGQPCVPAVTPPPAPVAPASHPVLGSATAALLRGSWARAVAAVLCVALAGTAYVLERLRTETFPSTIMQAPEHVFGVQKVEGRNQFSLCDLVTGTCREWRFCPKSPGYSVPFYAGFVILRLRVAMTGRCMFLDDTDGSMDHFVIARGKHRLGSDPYNSIYRDATYDEKRFPNWLDRPVLARNCASTPDDVETVCDGGEADFHTVRNAGERQGARWRDPAPNDAGSETP